MKYDWEAVKKTWEKDGNLILRGDLIQEKIHFLNFYAIKLS